MNEYIIKALTEEDAKIICTWKYEEEYTVYNLLDYDTVQKISSFSSNT